MLKALKIAWKSMNNVWKSVACVEKVWTCGNSDSLIQIWIPFGDSFAVWIWTCNQNFSESAYPPNRRQSHDILEPTSALAASSQPRHRLVQAGFMPCYILLYLVTSCYLGCCMVLLCISRSVSISMHQARRPITCFVNLIKSWWIGCFRQQILWPLLCFVWLQVARPGMCRAAQEPSLWPTKHDANLLVIGAWRSWRRIA